MYRSSAEPSHGPELPLRGTTRRLRRNLIALSAFLCLVGGGVLTLSPSLGAELDSGSPSMLAYFLLGLLGYWGLSFLCYATADLASWGRRGQPRGFWGVLLAPPTLLLELFVPVGAAAAAVLVWVPGVAGWFGWTGFEAELVSFRDERIVQRSEALRARAMQRADLALTQPAAEEVLADALLALRLDARRASDAALLAEGEAELRSKLHEVHLQGIVHAAELAELRDDAPSAFAYYHEALAFLANDGVDDAEQAAVLEPLQLALARLEAAREQDATASEPAPDAGAALPGQAEVALAAPTNS